MRELLLKAFPLLLDHLYASDVFRLSHALSHRHTAWPLADIHFMRTRIGVPKRLATSFFLATYMSRKRCRQCGASCHATHPRYCRMCTRNDINSPVLLVDRSYIMRRCPGRVGRHLLLHMRVVKRGGNRAHLYWKKDVDAQLALL